MADKVSQGESFKPSARVWNSMQEVSDWYQRFKRLNESGDLRRASQHDPDVLSVRNNSGANREAGEVLMIGDKLLTELEKTHPYFGGEEYDDTQALHSFGITDKDLPSTEIGKLVISGGVIAKVNVTDEAHRFAKPVNGAYVLDSDTTGPVEIVYKPSGTGEKECFVLLDRGDGPGRIKLYPFELMQDRSTGAYEERLPVLLNLQPGCGDLPESNPDAEAMIANWSSMVAINPQLNAQLAWYRDYQYPYARGPMEEADCGVVGGSSGAIGLLAFHPEVSLEDDDAAEENEEYCLKRFEVILSDQRSHRFSVVCKEDFLGDSDDDYWCYTARMDVSKAPQPLNQWPFSQAAHWWEFFGYLSDPGESTVESKETCSIQNVERYKGHIDDPGAVDWDESTGQWALSRTRVYSHRVVGDFRYNDCKIEGWYDDFKAYGKPPPDPEWETIIQLYQTTISKNLASYVYSGSDTELGTIDDVCVYEQKQATICTFNNLTEIEYGEEGYDDSDWKWADTNLEQTLYKYVSDVTIGSTEISFSTGYFFAACVPQEADPITIEFTEECPEDPPA